MLRREGLRGVFLLWKGGDRPRAEGREATAGWVWVVVSNQRRVAGLTGVLRAPGLGTWLWTGAWAPCVVAAPQHLLWRKPRPFLRGGGGGPRGPWMGAEDMSGGTGACLG